MPQGFVFRVEGPISPELQLWMDGHNLRHSGPRELILQVHPQSLPSLVFSDQAKEVFQLDFGANHYRQMVKTFGKHQLLPKALGIPKGVNQVWDLTAGLCEDAWAMASLGVHVTAFERHPLIFHLLSAALQAAKTDQDLAPIAANLTIQYGSFFDHAASTAPDGSHRAALFDPMFDLGDRKSKPKKAMRFLEEIVGTDADQGSILENARGIFRRIAVKRSPLHPELMPNPSLKFEGRGVRFDVYLRATP